MIKIDYVEKLDYFFINNFIYTYTYIIYLYAHLIDYKDSNLYNLYLTLMLYFLFIFTIMIEKTNDKKS